MFSLEIDCHPDDHDLLVAELWELGCEGIVELAPDSLRAFFDDSVPLRTLRERYPGARERREEPRDWVQASRDLLQPTPVGRRFFLVPVWRDDPAPTGRIRLTVNPGMAFGTGFHESTQLSIEALEDFVRPGDAVLDVGTGSGILARVAAHLGAARVAACDTDPDAIRIAGIGFIGSAEAVASSSADVVVANINPEAIAALAPDLLRIRRPEGAILLSGIESHELDTLLAALPKPREIRRKNNWVLLVL